MTLLNGPVSSLEVERFSQVCARLNFRQHCVHLFTNFQNFVGFWATA